MDSPSGSVGSADPGRTRRLTIVFVLDGLRPDSINPIDSPTLARLRGEGVHFENGHAVFPTVTRVNSCAIATGAHPGTSGVLGNTMYVREVDRHRAFSNDDWKALLKLDDATGGRMIFVPTLAERLQRRGLSLVAVSSGSTGSALLLNPRAPRGVGVLVSGYLDPGRQVAFPPAVSAEILSRFGPAPPKGGRTDRFDRVVDWTEDVLREYVLAELRPDVVLNWLTEPDHTQHAFGPGSPEARAAIQNDDRHLERILKKIAELDLADRTNIVVVSDHGFGLNTFGVDVARELIDAGLKAGPESTDVVVAPSGQTVLLHVHGRDAGRIEKIVHFLQSREWIGVVFTAPASGAATDSRGSVPGTFSLALIHAFNAERGPDVLFTFPWTSAPNAFGVAGADYANTTGAAGPLSGSGSDHGSMSPWNVRNTFLVWGPDFKRGATVRVPASNVDVAATVLALYGIEVPGLDGRVLAEALKDGPDEEQVPVETRVYTTEVSSAGGRAAIQITEAGGRRYVDKSWRIPGPEPSE